MGGKTSWRRVKLYATIVVGLVLGCSSPDPGEVAPARPVAEGPDVVLITIDTLRADRVGAYGDDRARTPVLDRLASEGALFREAIATTPLTLPSHASLLTGLYPAHHGLRDNGGFRLASSVETVAERLSSAGYRTGAFVSAYVLDAAWGLDQGFDEYRAPFHPADVAGAANFGALEISGAETVNAARAFLREEGAAFVWVHLFEPHLPWASHPGWDGDPYRGEVAYTDEIVGRLLHDVPDDALVIVTSDHGEGLWDHGEREHGLLVHRATTRVPLIIRPPEGIEAESESAGDAAPYAGVSATRRPEGVDPTLDVDPIRGQVTAARVVDTDVSGVDVAATVLDYAGLGATFGNGKSLKPLVEGEAFESVPVYAESWFPWFHHGWRPLRVLQWQGRRWRFGEQVELFELATDPHEMAPHVVTAEDVALAAPSLEPYEGETPTRGVSTTDEDERLAALGYVAAVTPSGSDLQGPDPRDRMDWLAALHRLQGMGATESAVDGLTDLIGQDPAAVDARVSLANALQGLGRIDEAIAATEEVLRRHPEHTMALNNLVVMLRSLERYDDALVHARTMQTHNPRDPRGFRNEAILHADASRPADVAESTAKGLEISPGDPFLLYLSGLALIELDRNDEAVDALRASQANGSRAKDIWVYIGHAEERAGRVDAARAAYDRAIRELPDDPRPEAAVAWMLYQADRCADAAGYLENLLRRGLGADAKIREAARACMKR